MDDVDFPVNRSDANHTEEVNPWKKHVIESDTVRKHPHKTSQPGERPDHVSPPRDAGHRMAEAMKREIEDGKTVDSQWGETMDNPAGDNPLSYEGPEA